MEIGIGLGITGGGSGVRGGKQAAIFSTGDSLAGFTGGTYGGTFATRMDGRFSGVSKSGTYFPGQDSATIRTALAARSVADRMSVLIIIAGRNGVLTDTSGTRAALQGILSDVVALGNTAGRVFFSKVPLKPTEQTAGAGNANYDLVVAHNAWLISTFGSAQVIDSQDIAYTYPSGDDTHVTNTGYDVWNIRASDVLAAAGVLDTSMPTTRATKSLNLDTTGKYEWVLTPDAANDRLPKAPDSTESSWFVWIKTTGASGGVIMGRYGNAVSTARLGIRYSGGSLFGFYGGGAFNSVVTAVPNNQAWNLVGITVRDVVGVKKGDLWLNGVVQGTQQTALALTTTWPVMVGEVADLAAAGGTGTSFAFLAKYYQPMVWNVGLTAAQVLTLYNGGVPLAASAVPQAAAVVHYPDIERISLYSVTRGIPDRAGKNDSRATGFTSADISTDIP